MHRDNFYQTALNEHTEPYKDEVDFYLRRKQLKEMIDCL